MKGTAVVLVPGVLIVLALLLLSLESIIVRRSVNGLVSRVHVNGTRGKSSVTRYVAAGLRASGRPTWGKITGVIPTIIDQDGSPLTIKRRGGPRVQEQFTIIRRASRRGIRNLVLECMSIQPELQRLESRVFRPHVYVMTNVRDDHREAFGADPESQADALCQAVPPRALVLTTLGRHVPCLQRYAGAVGSSVRIVDDLPEHLAVQLPEGVFAENVALALAACEACGVGTAEAWPFIRAAAVSSVPAAAIGPADGAVFVDGFAVNDVPSAQEFLLRWRRAYPDLSRLAVIFNARADRPLRSVSFAQYLPTIPELDRIILIGTHAPYMRHALLRAGWTADRLVSWSSRDIAGARTRLTALGIASEHLVVGLGNIGGTGHLVRQTLAGEATRGF